MNKKLVFHTLGNILIIDGISLILPIITALYYKEDFLYILSYLITIGALEFVGLLLKILVKSDKNELTLIDGFSIVGLAWISICLFGTMPYIISGSIPNFINALFETTSGFTTTGATILSGNQIEGLEKSILLYREMTHFIGGIGVLVFVLALLPDGGAKNISLLKAETTGPQASKLVSKVSTTAKILCVIYIVLTLLESILLVFDKDINYFDAICYSFSTAGTGGFANYATSCKPFSSYAQIVITVFMAIFGINFNIFYMLIIGKSIKAFKNEELRAYTIIMIVSMFVIALNIYTSGLNLYSSFKEALKDAAFETSSFMTSTGLTNANYDMWPSLSKSILFALSFIGACAGSTGGGLKVSRIVVFFKAIFNEIRKIFHPKGINTIKLDKEPLEDETVKGTLIYLSTIIFICITGIILISFDNFSFETNLTAVSACINNLGIGFGSVLNGANAFGQFGDFSKIILSILMLIGRLEIYPVLLLFAPKTWSNK